VKFNLTLLPRNVDLRVRVERLPREPIELYVGNELVAAPVLDPDVAPGLAQRNSEINLGERINDYAIFRPRQCGNRIDLRSSINLDSDYPVFDRKFVSDRSHRKHVLRTFKILPISASVVISRNPRLQRQYLAFRVYLPHSPKDTSVEGQPAENRVHPFTRD